MTGISKKSIFGIALLIILIIVILIVFYMIGNYRGFFTTILIGLIYITLSFLYTISNNLTSNNLFDIKKKKELIKSCPEYWRKEIKNDKRAICRHRIIY